MMIAGIVLATGCGGGVATGDRLAPATLAPGDPQRIVALAPSLTETLFALDLGERVVGVTRFCSYPPEAQELPEVGGYLDPNYEALVSLQPDLVILMQSHTEAERRLGSLGIPVLMVDQHDVAGVLDSINTIAAACGVSERGADLRRMIEDRLNAVRAMVASSLRPTVVLVVGHETGGGPVRSVWAAGPDTFYDDVLRLAGGVNVVAGSLARYPELGREGLAVLDPDVVLDMVAGLGERNLDIETLQSAWRGLTELRAVREERVRILEGDFMVVPGPRLPRMVETIAQSLHPDLDWGER